MSVACSSPPLLSSSSCSTATLDAQCSLSDLNHDHPRPVFPAGPQPRPSPPSVPCRTSTTTIHAQCSLPDLNREYPRQVFPAGPHVGRYGTKNVQKKVRKNVRQVCYILLANSRYEGYNICYDELVSCLRSRLLQSMPEDMPGRMPEDMPEDMPDRMPEDMPDRMPKGMPDRMPDKMSDRMPEDLPVTKCINVMVGITRSKVISFFIF